MWKICTATCWPSSAKPTTSALVVSGSTTVLRSRAFASPASWSRSTAARSKFRSAEASNISRSSSWTMRSDSPAMKRQKPSAISRCSSEPTLPTHGAEHFPMSPSRQGRPDALARLNTPSVQERMGNTRSSASTVSRMAQACPKGPK